MEPAYQRVMIVVELNRSDLSTKPLVRARACAAPVFQIL